MMTIEEAIELTRGVAELLEIDPLTGEPTPTHRLEYEQAQAIRMVLAELEAAGVLRGLGDLNNHEKENDARRRT